MTKYPAIWGKRREAIGREGPQSEIKVLVILCIIENGSSLKKMGDQYQIEVEEISYYFGRFVRDVPKLYGQHMLDRRPTEKEWGRGALCSLHETGVSGLCWMRQFHETSVEICRVPTQGTIP